MLDCKREPLAGGQAHAGGGWTCDFLAAAAAASTGLISIAPSFLRAPIRVLLKLRSRFVAPKLLLCPRGLHLYRRTRVPFATPNFVVD